MRILLSITGLGVGGAERIVCNLADHYTSLGHSVLLINLTGKPKIKPKNNDVEIINLHLENKNIAAGLALLRYRKAIIRFRPDVINTHMFHANLITRLMRLITPIPRLICSAHNTNEGSRTRMLAYRFTDALCEISTNVSQDALDAFVEQGAVKVGRMVVVQNGIDTKARGFDGEGRRRLRREMGVSADQSLLLAVGSLSEQKDFPNLLKAFANLRAMEQNVVLWIAGEGPMRGELERLTFSLGVNPYVRFLGLRNDVNTLMSASDVFVLASRWEGLPMVLLEAMVCKRPIVSTDCGGVRETLGVSNIIVPVSDPDALSNGIQVFLNTDESVLKEIGERNSERVKCYFSLESMAEKYLGLYVHAALRV